MEPKLQSVFQRGEQDYRSKCSYCHLASGQGMKKFLVNSKWVAGTDRSLIRILLQGKQGESQVMPGFRAELDDAQIASVLTYIRRQWGNQTRPVEPATVHEVRLATADRQKPWTEEELLNSLR
jgi:mono/diheme cytochrome c family protein